MEAPCVVRAKATFDTAPPRDLKQGEIVYLYLMEDDLGNYIRLHMISLEHPAKKYTLMFNVKQKLESWFEVLV